MSAVKTKAIILRAIDYGESSYILYLFTESHGLIHGISKGIRKKTKNQQFIERGFLVELLAYVRPHRELHTLGAVQTQEFFPSTRTSLVKTAVRDATFELILASITVSDPHPELFNFFVRFLEAIEHKPEGTVYPWLLWRFYIRFAGLTGFSPTLDVCIGCGRAIKGENSFFNTGRGGLECTKCSKSQAELISVADEVREFLYGEGRINERVKAISFAEKKRMTRLLDDFCRYHFGIRNESKALGFLEGL